MSNLMSYHRWSLLVGSGAADQVKAPLDLQPLLPFTPASAATGSCTPGGCQRLCLRTSFPLLLSLTWTPSHIAYSPSFLISAKSCGELPFSPWKGLEIRGWMKQILLLLGYWLYFPWSQWRSLNFDLTGCVYFGPFYKTQMLGDSLCDVFFLHYGGYFPFWWA